MAVFQPFKLRYAMLFADYGFKKEAKMYVDSIRKCIGIESFEQSEETHTSIFQGVCKYSRYWPWRKPGRAVRGDIGKKMEAYCRNIGH